MPQVLNFPSRIKIYKSASDSPGVHCKHHERFANLGSSIYFSETTVTCVGNDKLNGTIEGRMHKDLFVTKSQVKLYHF